MQRSLTQEENLRKKQTIGDWFIVISFVLFCGIVAIDLSSDKSVEKGLATLKKMVMKTSP